MTTINVFKEAGSFAENKDTAKELRVHAIIPALEKGSDVILDFQGVESTTQSFIHALISDLFRRYGISILDSVSFKGCNQTVQQIIGIVTEYMQESG